MNCNVKFCSGCRSYKELFYFGNDKRNKKDGLKSRCKQCESLASIKYKNKNLEKVKTYAKSYREKNSIILLEKARAYSKYYYANKLCKDKTNEYRSSYRKKNSEKIKAYFRQYHAERLKIDLNFKLTKNLRARINNALKGKSKSLKTVQLLGCSIQEFRTYLENKFTAGMSWENYGEWHLDHIRPCASFDLKTENEQKKCFNYLNLQPLWKHDNLVKKDKYNGLFN